MNSRGSIATGSALLLLGLVQPAYAYLDPGSGSLLLQIILGGLAGVAIAGKLFWTRILDFLGIKKAGTAETESDAQG